MLLEIRSRSDIQVLPCRWAMAHAVGGSRYKSVVSQGRELGLDLKIF